MSDGLGRNPFVGGMTDTEFDEGLHEGVENGTLRVEVDEDGNEFVVLTDKGIELAESLIPDDPPRVVCPRCDTSMDTFDINESPFGHQHDVYTVNPCGHILDDAELTDFLQQIQWYGVWVTKQERRAAKDSGQ